MFKKTVGYITWILWVIGILLYFFPVKAEEKSYKDKVYEQEARYEFFSRREDNGLLSKLLTLMTISENMEMLRIVDEFSLEHTPEDVKKLKELMLRLHIIHHDVDLSYEKKMELMYNAISDAIPERESTEGAIKIEDLLNAGKGDCNDIIPAYYALLTYYGMDVCWVIGKTVKNKTENDLHIWLHDQQLRIDLDPTWYWSYIKLPTRNAEIKCGILSDKYLFKHNP
jgi:hypothetical protein